MIRSIRCVPCKKDAAPSITSVYVLLNLPEDNDMENETGLGWYWKINSCNASQPHLKRWYLQQISGLLILREVDVSICNKSRSVIPLRHSIWCLAGDAQEKSRLPNLDLFYARPFRYSHVCHGNVENVWQKCSFSTLIHFWNFAYLMCSERADLVMARVQVQLHSFCWQSTKMVLFFHGILWPPFLQRRRFPIHVQR